MRYPARLLMILLATAASPYALAQTEPLLEHDFKDPSEQVDGWYHRHEQESWIREGADLAVVEAILKRIEQAPGKRTDPRYIDTMKSYGAGHWVFEWAKEGEAAWTRAQSDPDRRRQELDAAVVYFTVASWPHLGSAPDVAALARARDAYVARGQLMSPPLRHLEFAVGEQTTRGYLHLPPGAGPFPTLVYTNGSDVTKESSFGFFEDELRHRGIALFSVDLPGIGEAAHLSLLDGTDRVLEAATRFVRTLREVDGKRVFVAGASFGGNAAARAFFNFESAGVVSMCGPLHLPFMAPPQVFDALPALTIDGVKARLGILGESSERLAQLAPALSLEKQELWKPDRQIETPLLLLTTNRDPVAPLEDLEPLQSIASHVDTVILDQIGHCPPRWVREPIVAHWLQERLHD